MISVIVPVYNAEKYLEEAVDSIINQTYKDIEILLIDDGSTDESGLLCDKIATYDERVKVFHKENGGEADARNYGIKKALGDYIGFVDADDIISPIMYEKMIEIQSNYNADIVICGMYVENRDKCNLDEVKNNKRILSDNITVYDNPVELPLRNERDLCSVCNKLISKKMFENNAFRNIKAGTDTLFMAQSYLKKPIVARTTAVYYYYLTTPDGMSSNPLSYTKVADRYFVGRQILKLYKSNHLYDCQMKMARDIFSFMIENYSKAISEKKENEASEIKKCYDEIFGENSNVITWKKVNFVIFRLFHLSPFLGVKARKIWLKINEKPLKAS